MLTSRFRGLTIPRWQACAYITFGITRGVASHASLEWVPLSQAEPQLCHRPPHKARDKPVLQEKAVTRKIKPSVKKSELEVPEVVFKKLTKTSTYTPILEIDSLGREYELRYIEECRPDPTAVRIYRPESCPNPTRNKILYLPSIIPNSFFPSHDSIISTLSQVTRSTIIYPDPTEASKPFPHWIHNLLHIYDATIGDTPTVIITSGMAATTATAIGMTEKAVKAVGIWGGVFNLTKYSLSSTRWNRPLGFWEHIPVGRLPRIPTSTSSLAIGQEEFKAQRRHHFPDPETWVDPFASPLAFFRGSSVEFSRLNLTEIMGEEFRRVMVDKQSYNESDWESEVYIYPRNNRSPPTWNTFPPREREEDFPKIRIVAPEKPEDIGDKNDITASQAEQFCDTARKRLTDWLYSRVKAKLPPKTTKQNIWGQLREGHEQAMEDEEDQEIEEYAKLRADDIVTLDTLAKEVTGIDEVNKMANWVKDIFEEQSARN